MSRKHRTKGKHGLINTDNDKDEQPKYLCGSSMIKKEIDLFSSHQRLQKPDKKITNVRIH